MFKNLFLRFVVMVFILIVLVGLLIPAMISAASDYAVIGGLMLIPFTIYIVYLYIKNDGVQIWNKIKGLLN